MKTQAVKGMKQMKKMNEKPLSFIFKKQFYGFESAECFLLPFQFAKNEGNFYQIIQFLLPPAFENYAIDY